MYTSGQNLHKVEYESIGWRDGERSCRVIRQRPNTPGGSDDAFRFVQRSSNSRKPSTFLEIFHGFPRARFVRGCGLGHRVRNGSDATARVVENLDAGFQRIAAFRLCSRASDVPVHAVPAAGDGSESGTDEGDAGGDADFHGSPLRNPGGAGRLVDLFLQQTIDEGPIPESEDTRAGGNAWRGGYFALHATAEHHADRLVAADQRVHRRAWSLGESASLFSGILF